MEEINFLGVKLTANTSVSRRLNGEELVEKVQRRINIYKASRHIPLICKPHIANTFLLSTISYKAAVLDLRQQDIQKLGSIIKSWITQHLLRKPNEVMLYRSKEFGGLQLVNVKARTMANLLKTFIDQSSYGSPFFNNYLNAIFRIFVTEEVQMQGMKRPSYVNQEMISIIKEAIAEGEDIKSLTTKMWQDRITRRSITHLRMENGECTLIETTQESRNWEVDWDTAWTSSSTKGLSPGQKSTLFEFSNNLCVNNQYLKKIGKSPTPQCSFCGEIDARLHFLACPHSDGLGLAVVSILMESADDTFTADKLAVLDLKLQQHLLLPALLVMGEAIRLILEKRRSGKRVDISKSGALIKAKATSTARVKKHYNCGPIVLDWCDRFMAKDQHHAEAIELLKQRCAMSPIPSGAPAPSQEQMPSSPHPHLSPPPTPLGLQPSPPTTTTPPTLPSSHSPPGSTTIDVL